MKEDKNTERIIREKLEGFSASPPPHIWDNVKGQLAFQKRKKRLVVMSWISAAAVVLLAFLAGWYFNGNLKTNKNEVVKNEVIQTEKSSNESPNHSEETTDENTSTTAGEEQNSNRVNSPDKNQLAGVSNVSSKKTDIKIAASGYNENSQENLTLVKLESAKARVAQNQQSKTELAGRTETIHVNTLSEQEQMLIAENIKNINKSEKPENSWKMGMFIAPGYSSYSASHSENYSQDMTYSDNNGNANVGGGFSVQYKTSKRWIVESGIYYAQNGQQSENSANFLARSQNVDYAFAPEELSYFSNEVRVENNNLAMNSTAGVIQFDGTPKGAELSADFDASNAGVTNLLVPNGEFSQVFEFMEIPLFVRYRVVDSKFGVELITGLNTGIVVGNNAYINNQYGEQNIGETRDISTVNLSGTVGIGINYALGKHFAFAVEPRFNYYLNSINTNSEVEFRPYRIGFYTGVSYEF